MTINFKKMKVGDFVQLPVGEWHKNPGAKAAFAAAQEFAVKSKKDPKPQFQIVNEPGFNSKLERIR